MKSSKGGKKIFIIGGNARLSKAIIKHYKDHEIIVLQRQLYENWSGLESRNTILDFFKRQVVNKSIVFITSGILDSKENNSIIKKVNYLLPINVIKALNGIDIQIITFGTILEKIRNSENAYVKSKIRLSDTIIELKPKYPRVTHIRLHTLYGYGSPSKFMFLGQIFDSIKNKKIFNMSSGIQIREYHHFDDVVESIDIIVKSDIQGVSEITAGNGIRLRDLASGLFGNFQLVNLLNIGTIDIAHEDKYLNDYKKNDLIKDVYFREPVEGVTEYLKSLINQKSIK